MSELKTENKNWEQKKCARLAAIGRLIDNQQNKKYANKDTYQFYCRERFKWLKLQVAI
jgi:hypothetical protein